ncbi:sulfurtransferase TusA family protein [Caldicellulosiruptoraceae bacterium PP1]
MNHIKADYFVDITDVVCPITYVKVKATIEEIDEGKILEVRLNEGEALLNVPRSLKEDGHKILSVENNNDRTYTIYIQKGSVDK